MKLVQVKCTKYVATTTTKTTEETAKSAIWHDVFPANKTIAFPTVDELMTDGNRKCDGSLPFSDFAKKVVNGTYPADSTTKLFELTNSDGETSYNTTAFVKSGTYIAK